MSSTIILEENLEQFIKYSNYNQTELSKKIISYLIKNRLTICAAESCTGGLVSSALTDIPGSSKTFLGSVVTYSTKSKTDLLKIPDEFISEKGLYGKDVAIMMANGACELFKSDISISTTGVAGPGPSRDQTPEGSLTIALKINDQLYTDTFLLKGERSLLKQKFTKVSLQYLIKYLMSAY